MTTTAATPLAETRACVIKKMSVQCAECGSAFTTWPSRIAVGAGKYCSRPCQVLARSGLRHVEERFWSKVKKNGPVPPHKPDLGPCWDWAGRCKKSGYGVLRLGGPFERHDTTAHRLSWQLHYGEIPDGLFVCHHCDNPPCSRPDHLFIGTPKDNSQDAWNKGRLVKIHTTRHARGESVGGSKLTSGQVEEIRERYHQGGIRQIDISREYGIGQSNVSAIIRGEAWAHIPVVIGDTDGD